MTKRWYELGHQWRETSKSLRLWELNLISYLISPSLFYGTRSFTLYLAVCPGKLFRWQGCLQLYSLERYPQYGATACLCSELQVTLSLCLLDMRNITSTSRSSNTQKQPLHLPLTFIFFDAKLNDSFFSLPLISQGFQASPLAFAESVTF